MNRFVKFLALALPTLLSALPASAVDVAKVNGKVITDADVKASLAGFNEGQRRQILSDLNTRREVVNNLVDQELLIQEAEKQKLDKDSEYETAYRAFRRQYLTDRLLSKNVKPKLSEAAAKKYYQQNKRDYSTDKVQVQHILLSDEKTALEVLKQAKAPGADFQKLAEKDSKDPSAKNNRGDIGVITRDSPFVAAFKDAAFGAKTGEIVGPVKTQFGYHIIKVVDKSTGKILNYDEVELRVKSDLQREMVQNYITQLKKSAGVILDEKAITSLK
ncbi:MAG: peptidylprolyl isomerase [Bdellovibrionales bacterium]|nr:peptidylprolyl isomerase [Bdellovibrionales bacterium]